jgi:hypothetical protein
MRKYFTGRQAMRLVKFCLDKKGGLVMTENNAVLPWRPAGIHGPFAAIAQITASDRVVQKAAIRESWREPYRP